MDWISFFTSVGGFTIEYLWVPLGLWTIAALPLFIIVRLLGFRQPVVHYHSCMALLLSLPLGFLIMHLVAYDASVTNFLPPLPDYISTPAGVASEATIPFATPEAPQVQEVLLEKSFKPITMVGLITFFFLLTSLWMVISLFAKIGRLRTFFSNIKPATDPFVLAMLSTLTKSLSIQRSIQLMIAPTRSIPCTFGWRNPIIVIPEELLGDRNALKTTLLHELIHVQQHDYVLSLITRFISDLFIFHPMVFLLRRDVSLYRELTCDSKMITQKSVAPADYARLLLRFTTSSPSSFSISINQSKSALKKRITHMQYYSSPNPVLRVAILPIILLLPALLLSCSPDQPDVGESNTSTIELNDIGMSLTLPDGWRMGEQTRHTPRSNYESSLEKWPKNIHYILEKNKPRWRPNRLVYGTNYFLHTNMTEDNFQNLIDGKITFFQYDLSITYDRQRANSRERRQLWREGKCLNRSTGEAELCQNLKAHNVNYSNYKLVRQLDKTELPQGVDSGFLYEQDFQYGGSAGMKSRWLMYYFFAVRGNSTYLIRLRGTATQPDKAAYTENGTLLTERSISDLMASIRFH